MDSSDDGQILQEKAQTSREQRHSSLLQLPTFLLDTILDHLAVLDRCALALTCKMLVLHAHHNEHLEYIISAPPSLPALQKFFIRQLSSGWIPRDLRYCPDCGKFASIAEHHWRHVSEKFTRELTGRVAVLWRERREDGWLRYWIERWCEEPRYVSDGGSGGNGRTLKLDDPTALLCPRCAIVNPDTNAWRLRRVEKRNARHGYGNGHRYGANMTSTPGVGMDVPPSPSGSAARQRVAMTKSRLMSPGLNSPGSPGFDSSLGSVPLSPPPLPPMLSRGLVPRASEEALVSRYRQVPAWI